MTAGVRIFWLLSKWKKSEPVIQGLLPGLEHCTYWLGEVMAEEGGEWEKGQWEKGEGSPEMMVLGQLSSLSHAGVCM